MSKPHKTMASIMVDYVPLRSIQTAQGGTFRTDATRSKKKNGGHSVSNFDQSGGPSNTC